MPSKKNRKPIGVYFLIAGLAFLVSIFISNIPTFRSVELDFRDFLFEFRGELSVEDSPIVLVPISEEADFEIPQKYPWPTSVYAKLIENLNKAGAKVIVFDVIFDQPDQYDLKNDTLFAQAISKYGNVVLAGELSQTETSTSQTKERIFPRELFRSSNPRPVGLVGVNSDIDEAVRSYSFGRIDEFDNTDYYKLGLEALAVYKNIPRDSIESLTASNESTFKFGRYSILKDSKNSFIINYYGPENHFPVYDFSEVIDDAEYTTRMESEAGFDVNAFDDPEFESGLLYDNVFKDKIVIIGSTMPVLKDFYNTPLPSIEQSSTGSVIELPRPGYEIHAHAIQTILDDNYITRESMSSVIFLMIVFAILMVFINRSFSAIWGSLSMLIIMVIYTIIVIQSFLIANLFLNLTTIFITLLVSQIGSVGYQYFIEEKEKRRIQSMFSTYISPVLVEQMIESGTFPQLGGDQIYMTAFFSDIEAFSSFSEQMSPKQLVTLINEYLTSMTNILKDQGGTVDKFIGDAIIAFFGAPHPFEDHALRACISSQLMQKELLRLRKKWELDGHPDLVSRMKNRIGMNTGEMITGNMGSESRFNYTMMGDNVNLAARCESGAKVYGVYTMVTEATKSEAEKYGDDCLFRYLDKIVVKGRTQPVKIYEIVALRSDATPEMFECIDLYEQGMEAYLNQDWVNAIELFNKSLALEINDTNPSNILLDRCHKMLDNPPGQDWDGIFVMEGK